VPMEWRKMTCRGCEQCELEETRRPDEQSSPVGN
jgi:hypothetical protein